MKMAKPGSLDDVASMYLVDKDKMLDLAETAPQLSRRALELARTQLKQYKDALLSAPPVERIVFTGMGGSAIGGEIVRDWMIARKCSIPVEVVRDYSLPQHLMGRGTLLVAVSYSGDTEETLSCAIDAIKDNTADGSAGGGCRLVAITSGGRLQELAGRLKAPLITVPSGIPPRSALPYLLFSAIALCEKIPGLPIKEGDGEIEDAMRVFEELSKVLRPASPLSRNPSKKLAKAVMGTIPIVYGFGPYSSIASRMKAQFNENGKTVSFSEVFPELNHNSTVGWSGGGPLPSKCSIILLRDESLESAAITARIDATKRLAFSGNAHSVLEIKAKGKGILARMLSVMYVGDFASIYLALLKGVDPTPVPVISKLKGELARKTDTMRGIDGRIRSI